MTKRWSSGREELPIFHEERPLYESLFILCGIFGLFLVFALGTVALLTI